MKLPVAQRLHFTLSHETEQAILKREIETAIQHARESVESAYPEGLPFLSKPADTEARYQRYVTLTQPEDYVLLEQDNYIERFKKGQLPPMLSPFWKQLMLFPDLYREMRADFRKLLKDRQ